MRYQNEKGANLVLLCGAPKDCAQATIPRKITTDFTEITFEQCCCPTYLQYDMWLRHLYGEYMNLPSQGGASLVPYVGGVSLLGKINNGI